MNFAPVESLNDLDGLDHDQVVEGYASAERGDPEPGENRGRSYWHGWRCRMMDYGYIVPDEGHRRLVREYLDRQKPTPEPQRTAT
jgi:hypothetical protein